MKIATDTSLEEYIKKPILSEKVSFLITPTEQEDLQKNNNFLPMVHGKATDNIATMTGKTPEKNKLNNTGIIDTGEVKLVIEKFNQLSGSLGVSTHKLLSVAMANFTALNHTGTKKREKRFSEVNIPLKEYALNCGYDVIPHATETEEDATKERIRAKRSLDNARRKIHKDLNIMYSSSLTWKENVKGKLGDYVDYRLIEGKGIKNGYIYIKFSQTFSDYLINLPLTQFPIALLKIDERNNNAYSIGLKMAEHYNLDNNHIRGTSQLLRVSTLLSYTSLPDIDEIRKQRASWENRIKEPFEKALDTLTNCGLLQDWNYSHPKGVAMTDEEATNWGSYEEWANSLLHFNIMNAPDHTKRLEARAEKKKAHQAKKTKKKE